MTYLNQTNALQNASSPLHRIAILFRMWREHQRLRRDHKKLVELPDHLLRDVGLEHLIDHAPDRSFPHRLL